jgi:hypothetical protein
MINFFTTRGSLAAILGVVVILAYFTLRARSRSGASAINLDDLLLGEDGKVSKAAAVMMGSFAGTTWVIVYLTLCDKLTEGYFAAYLAAWVAPTVTKLIVNKPVQDTIRETRTTQTMVTTPPKDPP